MNSIRVCFFEQSAIAQREDLVVSNGCTSHTVSCAHLWMEQSSIHRNKLLHDSLCTAFVHGKWSHLLLLGSLCLGVPILPCVVMEAMRALSFPIHRFGSIID